METAIFQIKGTFKFKDEFSTYNVAFYSNRILIENTKMSTTLKYTDICKIKYNSGSIKIALKDGSKLKIPCTSSDINKIKTVFRIRKEETTKEIYGSALVTLGDLVLFVLITSNDFKTFKMAVFQRIAKHFYPACENDCLSLENFENLVFYLQLSDGNEILIDGSEDLHAAMIFTDNKLRINVKSNR